MKKLLALIATLSLVGCFNGGGNSKSPEQIKDMLQKDIPGLTKVDAVEQSPVPNMYQVVVGRKVFYATKDGKYLFFGNIIDPVSKQNITDQKVIELSKVNWNDLPLNLAIKQVNGDGSRKLVVFADPDCPYCKLFEKQVVPNIKNATIYTFLFPLPMHPNAMGDSIKIWCSKNREQVWSDWMRDNKPLPKNASCNYKPDFDKVMDVGSKLVQIDGTPTLILQNGQVVPGMIPLEQLEPQMEAAQKDSK